MKAWPLVGIALMQSLLLAAHWFIYRTWIDFWGPLSPPAQAVLRTAIVALAFSFIAAALLGFYSASRVVALIYRLAAVWLGFLNFFFLAACLSWIFLFVLTLAHLPVNRPLLAATLYTLAVAAVFYGLVNARLIRIRHVSIKLEGLPDAWRGSTALVISDLHLGHVNGAGFCRRIVALAAALKPDIVFLPGDLFDGSKVNAQKLAAPLHELTPPRGMYFSTGNHDEFGDTSRYAQVLERLGIHVLVNEKITVDGVDILGVSYGDSGYPIRMRGLLETLAPSSVSILLNHVPNRLPIVEQAGISLQLSGHTHGGQIFPFTWFTRRAFGKFIYGLQRFGRLQVYTSSGAGTWGPPMRVGTNSEIVQLTFE